MYSKTTHNITVTVTPNYTKESSSPIDHRYVWTYTVCIKNSNGEAVQLFSRHWKVVEGYGLIREVEGKGVIGQQPVIPAGGSFDYTSQVHLTSPSGIMVGSYQMQFERSKERVEVDVPAFSLDYPDLLIVRH